MPALQLPIIQNWSCHNCGGCCHQHLIELSAEDEQRIRAQNWSDSEEIPDGQPIIEPLTRRPWNRRFRLAHQPNGACVFLRDDGLCRIHARFGEEAKPLACRIYPYVFHPAGKHVTASLRFSCPTIVSNLGETLRNQQEEIGRTARLVIPEGIENDAPPALSGKQKLGWPDLLRIVRRIDDCLDQPRPIEENLRHVLRWLNLIEEADLDRIQGGNHLDELLHLIIEATREPEAAPASLRPPDRMVARLFRQLAAVYARRDTIGDLQQKGMGRLKLLGAAFRFALGTGLLPTFQEGQKSIPFARLEEPLALPIESDERLRRLLRVKVQGLHFCGRGYYGVPLIEGFVSLALEYVAINWMARWLACSADAPTIRLADLERAIAIVDHHHGFSPALGGLSARTRVRILRQLQGIDPLIRWYGASGSVRA